MATMVAENSPRFRRRRSVLHLHFRQLYNVKYSKIVAGFGDYSHRFWGLKRRLVASVDEALGGTGI